MEPNIELHFINTRLKILSIKKNSIHKLMYPLIKIAFTKKTSCNFFSFTETNDDYSIVVDLQGYNELSPYLNEQDLTLSQSSWMPMYLCGDDLPGAMSLSKIAKYLILPLADWKISIMAISMYQCDYILVQEKDYETVVHCLANHIPKIYNESLNEEDEIVYMKSKGGKPIFNIKSINTVENNSNKLSSNLPSTLSNAATDRQQQQLNYKQRQITLPLLIPDQIEYCITGLYNFDTFFLIIPILIEIMFYESRDYNDNEIFFNFTKKEQDISLVMETRLLNKFPQGTLLNVDQDYWKMIRIGQAPVGFEVFGVCASISQPLELGNIDEYYISSYHTGYCFIPTNKLDIAKELFAKVKAKFVDSSSKLNTIYQEENIDENTNNKKDVELFANSSDSNSSDPIMNGGETTDELLIFSKHDDNIYQQNDQYKLTQQLNNEECKNFSLLQQSNPENNIQVIQ